MFISVDANYKEYYESGALDYVLDCIRMQGSFDNYKEWLKGEPVASWSNDTDWHKDDENNIIWRDPNSDEEEKYPITAIIQLGDDVILHSCLGSSSMFYKLLDNNRLEALYVD